MEANTHGLVLEVASRNYSSVSMDAFHVCARLLVISGFRVDTDVLSLDAFCSE
jgi:hypothetical protein